MSFDMEPDHDEHAECRHEIKRLRAVVSKTRRWLATELEGRDVPIWRTILKELKAAEAAGGE